MGVVRGYSSLHSKVSQGWCPPSELFFSFFLDFMWMYYFCFFFYPFPSDPAPICAESYSTYLDVLLFFLTHINARGPPQVTRTLPLPARVVSVTCSTPTEMEPKGESTVKETIGRKKKRYRSVWEGEGVCKISALTESRSRTRIVILSFLSPLQRHPPKGTQDPRDSVVTRRAE